MNQPSRRGLNILIVDDEELQRRALSLSIDDTHSVFTADSPEEALRVLDEEVVDLALVDLRLGTASGLELIPGFLSAAPWMRVVVLTAHATVESAVEAMRAGASDYLVKPVDTQAIRILVERFAASRRLERQVAALEADLNQASPPPLLKSRNPAMQRVIALADTVATSQAVVLLRGESGTGKGVLARRIHRSSSRAEEVFSVINCPSLSPELLQSELFGHVKGAFTGAVKSQMGKVEVASGGTLFLDEVGDLPPRIQPKLLRFIQDREYERVGDPRTRRADVRIISATNKDLRTAIDDGDFREDLLYRLNVVELEVPPLRERPEDVEDLAKSFLAFFTQRHDRKVEGFTPPAWSSLMRNPWRGNVRELQNAVERAVILCTTRRVPAELLPNPDTGVTTAAQPSEPSTAPTALSTSVPGGSSNDIRSLEELEKAHIAQSIEVADSLGDAARALGISPSTLLRKRKRYGL